MGLALASQGVVHQFAVQLDVHVHAGHEGETALMGARDVVNHRPLLVLVIFFILDMVQVPGQAAPVHAHHGSYTHLALAPHGVTRLQAHAQQCGVGSGIELQVASRVIQHMVGVVVLERRLAIGNISLEPQAVDLGIEAAGEQGATLEVIAQRPCGQHAAHTHLEAHAPAIVQRAIVLGAQGGRSHGQYR